MQEIWANIEEAPFYGVSTLGRVEDRDKRKFVPARQNVQGVMMVTLRDESFKQITRSLSLIVARAFVDIPFRFKPHFKSVIHLNGDRTDCRSLNLMWRSRPFTLRYHEMFKHEPYRVSVRIPEKNEFYYSLRELCVRYGVIEEVAYSHMRNGEPVFPYRWTIEEIRE